MRYIFLSYGSSLRYEADKKSLFSEIIRTSAVNRNRIQTAVRK